MPHPLSSSAPLARKLGMQPPARPADSIAGASPLFDVHNGRHAQALYRATLAHGSGLRGAPLSQAVARARRAEAGLAVARAENVSRAAHAKYAQEADALSSLHVQSAALANKRLQRRADTYERQLLSLGVTPALPEPRDAYSRARLV